MERPPPALAERLTRELRVGERLLWSGQPDPATVLRRALVLWGFFIPWTVFSLGWEAAAIGAWLGTEGPANWMQAGMGAVFVLFGLPFVGIGLYMLWQPFAARRDARATLFGLTDQRLMLLKARAESELKSVELRQMGPVTRREKKNGTGTIIIETHSSTDSDGDRRTETVELTGIAGVAQVHRRLMELLQR